MTDECPTDTLFEVKDEVVRVKKILDQGGSWLGMSGETLITYFNQQRTKEKYLESIYKDNLRPVSPMASTASPGFADATAQGYQGVVETPVAPELPSGTPDQFDENNAKAICDHMSKYAASASESAKALKALASLAYKSPRTLAGTKVVSQTLRLLALHPSNNAVMLTATKAIFNIAYDEPVARANLATKAVLHALIDAMCNPSSAEVRHKSSGAIALIVKADAARDWQDLQRNGEFSGLHLFTLASGGTADPVRAAAVVDLVKEVLANEVMPPAVFAQRFIEAAKVCEASAPGAEHWLNLASMFSKDSECLAMKAAMVKNEVMAAVRTVLSAHLQQASIQFAGMATFNDLIGTDFEVLQAFAKVKGIECIDVAMVAHPKDATIQKRGMKCVQGGAKWTNELREQAGFTVARAIELTKIAMATHRDVLEVQVAAIEALYKYMSCPDFDHKELETALKSGSGLELVTAALVLGAAESESPFKGDEHAALSRYMAKAAGA